MTKRKITLKTIWVNDKNQQGEPYLDKYGNQFWVASITSETGAKATLKIWNNQWWKKQEIETWRPGDEVEVTLEQSGEYWNFDIDIEPPTWKNIESRMQQMMKGLNDYRAAQGLAQEIGGEVKVEDCNF